MKKQIPSKLLPALLLSIVLTGCVDKNTVPNLILVLTDDQGYGDISAHGSPDVFTPNMDKLKSQGISLEDFHVSPTCAPTRSAIMTGRHPFKNGVTHTILERERMALGIATLPEILKRKSYTSGIFGKWHLGDEAEYQPGSRGFDEVFIHGAGGIGQAYPGSCADVPANGYFNPIIKHNGKFVQTSGFCTDVFFEQAISWIKENSGDKKPFFAYISTNAPHGPFIAPEEYKNKFAQRAYTPNSQGFYAMIENIDDNLGILMEKLDDWGISDNTILIFMSDNGKTYNGGKNGNNEIYNAGMKGFKVDVHEGGTRVPFFIRWPAKIDAGRSVEVLLNHYDILATFADIANIDISDIPHLDGQSFFPFLENASYTSEDRYRFVHRGRWGLNPKNISDSILYAEARRFIGSAEDRAPDSYKYKYFAVRNERYRFVENNQLYDVIEDPGETTNIADEHPEVVAQMREAYEAWWEEVRPYMVNEDIPLPTEKPFWIEYYKQKETEGIQAWKKPNLD